MATPPIDGGGTTSAHAENTIKRCRIGGCWRNYLRARGEYLQIQHRIIERLELPPRTRRIPALRRAPMRSTGTTSAHAENTDSCLLCGGVGGNYLRARGEYLHDSGSAIFSQELPPRTRRIQLTASGCDIVRVNYLRARGEYRSLTFPARNGMELPPRTRRIHPAVPRQSSEGGTTSAHAENTFRAGVCFSHFRNYLRARGEYPK